MTRCHSSSGELPGVAAVDDASVVHGHVEFPEALDRGGPDALDGVGITHVDTDGQDFGPLLHEPRRMRSQAPFVDIGHDDPHPCRGEGLGQGQPDAAGGTRHDGGPTFELLHGVWIVTGKMDEAPDLSLPLSPVGEDGAGMERRD